MKTVTHYAILITTILVTVAAAMLIVYAGNPGTVEPAVPQGATMSIPF